MERRHDAVARGGVKPGHFWAEPFRTLIRRGGRGCLRAFLTLFLASPAPCCADVTPAINYYAGLDIIEVLTKCRANISGAVTSALLPRLLPREMRQMDCDGFGNRKAR